MQNYEKTDLSKRGRNRETRMFFFFSCHSSLFWFLIFLVGKTMLLSCYASLCLCSLALLLPSRYRRSRKGEEEAERRKRENKGLWVTQRRPNNQKRYF